MLALVAEDQVAFAERAADYNRRTSAERTNKREKVDYKLAAGRHRSSMIWYMRVFGIMMCQHIDAWHLHSKDSLRLKTTLLPAA